MTIDNIDLKKGKVKLKIFTETDAALAELRKEFAEVPDVSTKAGYELVKAGIKKLSGYRTKLEAARKETKQPFLDAGRILDTEAKRIAAVLVELETPLKNAKKVIDDKENREKEERLNRLRGKVQQIKDWIQAMRGKTSEQIAEAIEAVDAIDATRDFYDLTNEAVIARSDVLDELNRMYAQQLNAEQQEQENARLKNAAKIDERVNNLKMTPANMIGESFEAIKTKADQIETFEPNPEQFGDRYNEVIEEKAKVVTSLRTMQIQAKQLEELQQQQQADIEPEAQGEPDMSLPHTDDIAEPEQEIEGGFVADKPVIDVKIDEQEAEICAALSSNCYVNYEQAFNIYRAIKDGQIPYVTLNQ